LLQPSVSGVAVSLLVSGLTVDILSTFCRGSHWPGESERVRKSRN